MEVLYAIESLLNARPEISRREFRDFVSGTLSRAARLQGLAWDPRVPAALAAEWEARAHDDGFRDLPVRRAAERRTARPRRRAPGVFSRLFHGASRRERTGARVRSAVRGQAPGGARAGERYRPGDRDASDPAGAGARLATRISRPAARLRAAGIDRRAATDAACEGFAVAVYRDRRSRGRVAASAVDERARRLGRRRRIAQQEIYRRDAGVPAGMPWETTIDAAGRRWTVRFSRRRRSPGRASSGRPGHRWVPGWPSPSCCPPISGVMAGGAPSSPRPTTRCRSKSPSGSVPRRRRKPPTGRSRRSSRT